MSNSNIYTEYHNKSWERDYTININNTQYRCNGFEKIILTIPKLKKPSTIDKIFDGALAVVSVAAVIQATSAGQKIDFSEESSEYETIKISVIRLVNSDGYKVIDVTTDENKEKIFLAMKKARKQCEELLVKNSYGMDILESFYKNDSTIVVVGNTDSVIEQFITQDKKREQEIKKAEAQKRHRIEQRRKKIAEDIIADFENQNLLQAEKLSNIDKIAEYTRLREFCIKYIPLLPEHNFSICSVFENYSDYVSEESFNAFEENWSRISRSYSVLTRGINGETKVFEVLQLFDDRIRILKDYVWEYEHDFVIITPYGISTVEVKNLRGNYVMTETGIMKCLSTQKVKPKDVALQSKKHLENLRRKLSACKAFSAKVPLQEIICSAEPNFTIEDNYHYIPICYYNTIDKVLLPETANVVLEESAMDEIKKFLLENQQETFRYDVFLPRGEIDSRAEFICNFAEVASAFIVAQDDGD